MARMWIAGEWCEAKSGQRLAVENPATEQTIDEVPRGGAEDAARAVEAARAAFPAWAKTRGLERCDLLHHVAAGLRARRDELARLLTLEGGKPLIENRDEVEWTAACFDYYAELGRDLRGRVIAPVFPHQFNAVIKEPYGVVAAIVPWNYPLLLLGWKLAPALAAGNTVVIKPSEITPLATLAMVGALEHLPRGVVGVLTGLGAEAGDALVRHRHVDLVAFTGSLAVGRKIAAIAAERIAKLNLELSGVDPFIVCDDVDLDVAVRGATWAAFLNAGQVCTSAKRFYVFAKVYDEFVERMAAFARTLRLGDPMGPDVDLGPLVSGPQRDKLEKQLAGLVARGAQVRCGGRRPAHLAKGYYFEPTIVTDADGAEDLICDELFGPVRPIFKVAGIDEAVARANDSNFGLGATIFTTSLERAFQAAEGIKAGTFWVNDPLTDNDAGPFGGMRQSGWGRELGHEGLEAFLESKHLHLDWKLERKSYWFPYDWSQGRKTE